MKARFCCADVVRRATSRGVVRACFGLQGRAAGSVVRENNMMAQCRKLVFAMCIVGCGSPPEPSSTAQATDECSDFELDVQEVWSEESNTKVEADLMGQWQGQLGVDTAETRAREVVTKMDNIARDWVMLRRSVCLDHFKRGIGSASDYQARASCLDRILSRQRLVLTQLEHDADAGVAAMAGLESELQQCR